MKIRIEREGVKYCLCVGYKREIGMKKGRAETFLFFAPEMSKRSEEERVMLAVADSVVAEMTGRPRILVAAHRVEFDKSKAILWAYADKSDVFALGEVVEKERWLENLSTLIRQGRMIQLRLRGESTNGGTDLKQYLHDTIKKRTSARKAV